MNRHQIFHVAVLLGFSILMSIGLFHDGFQYRPVDYVFCAVILLFLVLIVRQLLIWNISQISHSEVELSRFFGLSKVYLNTQQDLIKVEADVEFKALSDFEIAKYVCAHTTKGKFQFYSKDYRDFDKEIQILLGGRKDLLLETRRQLKRKRRNRKDYTWIYLALAIILLFVSWLQSR
jgi:hypothetical protein